MGKLSHKLPDFSTVFLNSEFSKFIEYKVNIQKLIVFLYISDNQKIKI